MKKLILSALVFTTFVANATPESDLIKYQAENELVTSVQKVAIITGSKDGGMNESVAFLQLINETVSKTIKSGGKCPEVVSVVENSFEETTPEKLLDGMPNTPLVQSSWTRMRNNTINYAKVSCNWLMDD